MFVFIVNPQRFYGADVAWRTAARRTGSGSLLCGSCRSLNTEGERADCGYAARYPCGVARRRSGTTPLDATTDDVTS